MSSLALVFVGAVLLSNGLVFLGAMSARAAIPINLLVGALLVATALLAAIPAGADRLTVFGALGFALFGITYLVVGVSTLLDAEGSGVGWYCGWAAVIAAVLAGVHFAAGDARIAWLWVSWIVLFAAFFLAAVGGGERFGTGAGVVAVIHSVTTATVPGLLMVDGAWDDVPIVAVVAVQLLGLVGYGAAVMRPRLVPQPA
ncbi:AmiS/UreI family transporter [Gordonia shandongensis]|uniref:AmiS/UreI family transporter n=1 Tax=Gordonia shandongensis TaxID=376351 RepID=UPI00040BF11A|nr:AmiS/UreI family transporter [Gordonia shandongensis]